MIRKRGVGGYFVLLGGLGRVVVRGRDAEAVRGQLKAASRLRDGQLHRVSSPGSLEKNVSGRRACQIFVGVKL